MGLRKHIDRGYSAHQKKVVRPEEYTKVEIISYDHEYTVDSWIGNQLFTTNNAKTVDWQAWVGYQSLNETTRFEIDIPYNVYEHGEYRIDVLYINKDGREMTGMLQIFNDGESEPFIDDLLQFEGDIEFSKRKVSYYELPIGQYNIRHRLPVNCIFIGVIVRKIHEYTYTIEGTDADSFIEEWNINKTKKANPVEASLKIPYDSVYVDENSPSGFVFDYRQELNIYANTDDRDLKHLFGGYISSVLPDGDTKYLTITGADRLVDGMKRYVMEEMVLQGGDSETPEYFEGNVKDFNSHPEALQYLAETHEETLHTNIGDNYLVAGETYSEGFNVTLGNKGTVTKPINNNSNVTIADHFILVRNNPDQTLTQTVQIYNNNDYQADPPKITEYPLFYLTYGLGDPATKTESVETITTENVGEAPASNTITVNNVAGLCGRCGYTPRVTSTFLNKCPMCGRTGSLRSHVSYSNSGKPTNDFEVSCMEGGSRSKCGADFCPKCGNELNGSFRSKLTKIGGTETTTETTTTEVTTTTSNGYDKTKPWEGYIHIIFSDEPGKHGRQIDLLLDFTKVAAHSHSFNGIKPVLINNVVKQGMINVREYMELLTGKTVEETDFYLHQVKLVTNPSEDSEKALYESSENNIDNSSCKMDFYGFGFRDGTIINPTNLSSCGKTVNNMIDTLVTSTGYLVDITYAKHRKDDVINFQINNQLNPVLTLKEGNNNNIINISNISYTPISTLYNNSVCVYKTRVGEGEKYHFVNSKKAISVLNYGELTTLETSSEIIEDRQAYFNARKATNYSNEMMFSYTITTPGVPDVEIGDLVKCVLDNKVLSDIKDVQSVNYSYSRSRTPKLRTQLGLGEMSKEFKVKKQMEQMREETKIENTVFSSSASYTTSSEIFEWEQ
ncbi:hypothetical protein [Methanobrevibacter sp. DSM 116169]|uniref:hypothetical protein n=1 Tax=Methanobrevibacter sp. DSM 116169 TaxID=3242727 RepID=UPI0038FD1F07